MTDTATRLLTLITRHIGPIPGADPLDAHLVSECKADSLHLIELAMACEDEFGVDVSDDDLDGLGDDPTVRELCAMVAGKMEDL